jgi:hypothetical protein
MFLQRYPLARLCMTPDDGTGGGGAGTGDQGGGEGGAGTTIELPKSSEELTKLIQAETEKALKVSQGKWQKDFDIKLESEKAEAARLSKLTSDEREKELEKKKNEELNLREATIKGHELTLKATDLLTTKGLPLDIRSLVIGKDEADTVSRIEAFEGVFQKAVEAAVNIKLSGGAKPGTGGNQDKGYEDMSMDEIRAKLTGKK